MTFGIGQPALRVEDRRFLTGTGQYTDDINLPGQLHAVILHSPHASARIGAIDSSAAAAMAGVKAVYTGADVAADGLGNLPCLATSLVPLSRPDGNAIHVPSRPPLVHQRAAFAGDYVAMVVADDANQARDAAEAIQVDYQALPANISTARALESDCPAVWPDCPDNIAFTISLGDQAKVDTAFAAAAHISRRRTLVSRIAMNPMEPRAALGAYDAGQDRYTLYSGNQGPHDLRQLLAEQVLKIPQSALRVVSPDMGGAFGLRGNTFPEMALVLWAARKLGRPVKWTGDRSEAFLTDDQGRDMILETALALSRDGEFLALRLENVAAMGAYLSMFGPFPAFGNMGGLAGVYRTPAIAAKVTGVFTNTTPIGPYRGAGRPEAILALESLIDQAAREIGLDRIELRRRNLIASEAMPFQTGLSYCYDSGDFAGNMIMLEDAADLAGFEARRRAAAAAGKLRGLGFINAIEQSAGLFDEGAGIEFDNAGHATIAVGTHSHGQGHETVFRQLINDRLGLDFGQIRFVQGDTDLVPHGHGTFGSRSAVLGGNALSRAADAIVEDGRRLAGHLMEAPAEDIEFAGGEYRITGTDRSVSLAEVARVSFSPAERPADWPAGLRAFASFTPPGPTFPNASHAAEVEIDQETGRIRIIGYWLVSDVGTVLNPMLLDGQLHGGVAQGVGQILLEEIAWAADSGQLLTGSFMDYCMPRADDLPFFEIQHKPVPTQLNALGVKGAGESGTVGAMPCVVNAVADALAPAGAGPLEMPLTPEKIWRALQRVDGRVSGAAIESDAKRIDRT